MTGDEDVTSNKTVRKMEARIRELERRSSGANPGARDPQGSPRKIEGKKTDLACPVLAEGRFAVKAAAKIFGVSRSNLHERIKESAKPRSAYRKFRLDLTFVRSHRSA